MAHPRVDRARIRTTPLAERTNRVFIETDHVRPDASPRPLGDQAPVLAETVARIRRARTSGRPVVLAFGAHAIKNGLAPVLQKLIRDGWITHLATNGAGVIHDWEFAYLGASSEHVRQNIEQGRFGTWEETGYYINLAINVGAYRGLGYGESVGAFIHDDGLEIPSPAELQSVIGANCLSDPPLAAAAADLLAVVQRFGLPAGRLAVAHRGKAFSIQAAAHVAGVPFTAHPMFGHDVIYTHPMNHGAAIGRTAERDFLSFAESIRRIDGGVYLSVGSAVMSPMIFEKSLSMARNLARQEGRTIDRHFILVVDLAESGWDWTQGEPPEHHPAYYLRFNKTFHRMGGTVRYLRADNRDALLHLCQALD